MLGTYPYIIMTHQRMDNPVICMASLLMSPCRRQKLKVFVPTITYPTLAFKPSNLKDIKQVIHERELHVDFNLRSHLHNVSLIK